MSSLGTSTSFDTHYGPYGSDGSLSAAQPTTDKIFEDILFGNSTIEDISESQKPYRVRSFDGLSTETVQWLQSDPKPITTFHSIIPQQSLKRVLKQRHLVQQPHPQSSVASCVAMLLLDNGITPNYERICASKPGTAKTAYRLLMEKRGTKAGTVRDIITSTVLPTDDRALYVKRLKHYGPAIVLLDIAPEGKVPYIGAFILDSIRIPRGDPALRSLGVYPTASIRSPESGRAYEIRATFLFEESPTIRSIRFIQMQRSQSTTPGPLKQPHSSPPTPPSTPPIPDAKESVTEIPKRTPEMMLFP